MRKILLFSSVIISGAFNAQVTLTQANHAPANGETYSMLPSTSIISGPGASGASVMWNFATITLTSTANAYTASTNANTSFTPANVVVANSTESSYYLSSSNDLKYYGGNQTLSGFPVTLTYTSPAIYAKYPMTITTTSSNPIGGSISGGGSGSFTGNSTAVANGQGTLMLPGKTYTNVLRVLATQTINFAIPAFLISNGVLNQDVYNFYVPGKKNPVLSIIVSTVVAPPIAAAPSTNTVILVASDYLVTGLNENTSNITDLLVYPNPATNFINLTTQSNDAKTVVVYDLTGKKLDTQNFSNKLATIKTTNLLSGIYFYEIKDNANQTLKSGKFSVSH